MRQPIEQMLLPDETVLYRARVHWAEIIHAGFWLWVALLAAWGFWHMQPGHGPLISLGRWIGRGTLQDAIFWFHRWFTDIPDVVHGIILITATIGSIRLFRAMIERFFTQMVITDSRIIVRRGVYSIHLIEIDRRRVASVMINQSFYGRMFNYGYMYIQGFGASIYGLPALANPHTIQRHIYSS